MRGAIEDPEAVAAAIDGGAPEAIVNFAAETHVDRSIAEPDAFVTTHALGTYVLLEAARERELRYVQVSTDEVYGSIEEGTFTEESPLRPSSPYSATKTGADLLVQSYFHTYGLPAMICRGSNNYGPYQYPEKLIPLMILNALHGDALPVYGDGMQVRNWIHATRLRARDRARARARRAGRGLQRGRPRRGGEHRRRRAHRRADRRRASRRSSTSPTAPATTAATRSPREKVRALGWEPQVRFERGPRARPSPGIARTRGGGSRSARATTAPTTSASTGARWQSSQRCRARLRAALGSTA